MDLYYRYRDWVRRNGNVLALAETGLSTLTWLLPDRFTDNEFSLEAVHTGINLISALHDSILNEPSPGSPPGAAELTFALNALQQVQVLVELWGLYNEHNGSIQSRYDPLIAVEGLKSIVRLGILQSSKTRILSNGGATAFEQHHTLGGSYLGSQPHHHTLSSAPSLNRSLLGGQRDADSEAKARQLFAAFATFRDTRCFLNSTKEKDDSNDAMVASGTTTTTTTNGADKTDVAAANVAYWWEQGRGPIRPPSPHINNNDKLNVDRYLPSNIHALRQLESSAIARQAAAYRLIILGEIIHVMRPLIYVSALRAWGRKSWKPWALSLCLELASSRLAQAGARASQRAASEAAKNPAVAGTALACLYGMQGVRWKREELDELTRRKLLLLFSLLRDPFFSKLTGPAVERWTSRATRLPLIGRVAEKAAEIVFGMQKYYSYTAAS